jgi:hypothetical protein
MISKDPCSFVVQQGQARHTKPQHSCKSMWMQRRKNTNLIHIASQMDFSNRWWKATWWYWGNQMSGNHQSQLFHWRWCWDARSFCTMMFEWVIHQMHTWEIWPLFWMRGSRDDWWPYTQQTSQRMSCKKSLMRGLWAVCYTIQMWLFSKVMIWGWKQHNTLMHRIWRISHQRILIGLIILLINQIWNILRKWNNKKKRGFGASLSLVCKSLQPENLQYHAERIYLISNKMQVYFT